MQTQVQIINQPQSQGLAVSKTPPPLSLGLPDLQNVSNASGTSLRNVQVVNEGVMKSMRNMSAEGLGMTVLAVVAELEFCATTYCGAQNTTDEAFEEMADFVMERFGSLGVKEISQAFRLAAAGDLGVIDMNAYYGQFTVITLGKILRLYGEYRDRIIAEMRVQQSKLDAGASPKKSWDSHKWGKERLRDLLSKDSLEVEYFTTIDYDYFTESGHFAPTKDQKWAAWDESESAVRNAIAAAALKSRDEYNFLLALKRGQQQNELNARRKCWSQRKLVFDWVVGMKMTATLGAWSNW